MSPVKEKSDLVMRRQEQVLSAATKLFIKKGFHKTTVRDIARESGLGIGPIYDYVKNKEEILFMIHSRILNQIYKGLEKSMFGEEDSKEKLRGMIEFLFNMCDRHQNLVMLIYQESHILSNAMQKKIMAGEKKSIVFFEKVLEEGIKNKVFAKCNTKFTANMIIAMVHGWVLKRWDLKNLKRETGLKYTIVMIMKTLSV